MIEKIKSFWSKKWKTSAGIAVMVISQLLKAKITNLGLDLDDNSMNEITSHLLDLIGLGGGVLSIHGIKYRTDKNAEAIAERLDKLQELVGNKKEEVG